VLITRWLGPLHAYMLFALLMATGLAAQWWRWHREVRHLADIWQQLIKAGKQRRGDSPPPETFWFSRRGLVAGAVMQYLMVFWLETFLLMLPGLITSGLSLVLMVMFWNYKTVARRTPYVEARAKAIKELEERKAKQQEAKQQRKRP